MIRETENSVTLNIGDRIPEAFRVPCEWFALCPNVANVANVILGHPILKTVPTCDDCAAKVAQYA